MALVHHWKLDEANATDVAVDSVGGLNLTPASGNEPTVVSGFFGRARRFASGQYLQGSAVASAILRGDGVSLTGDHSLNWWMACDANAAASGGVFFVGMADPSIALNRLWVSQMKVEIVATTEKLRGGHTYASNTGLTWNGNNVTLQQFGVWMMHTIVLTNGSWQLYCNGVAQESGSFSNPPYAPGTSGAPAPDATFMGRTHDGTSTPRYLNDIQIKGVKLFSHALTSSEVGALFIAGMTPDNTAPVISNVTPTAGGTIGRNDTFGFRVTDDVGFRRVMVLATLLDASGTERGREVVWDGAEFAAAYDNHSERTEVSAGLVYDFSVRRNSGWPFSPTFDVYAIDTAGNEGT